MRLKEILLIGLVALVVSALVGWAVIPAGTGQTQEASCEYDGVNPPDWTYFVTPTVEPTSEPTPTLPSCEYDGVNPVDWTCFTVEEATPPPVPTPTPPTPTPTPGPCPCSCP